MIEPAPTGPLPKTVDQAVKAANAMSMHHEGWLERSAALLTNENSADGKLERQFAELAYTTYLTAVANCRRTRVTELRKITERFVARREDKANG